MGRKRSRFESVWWTSMIDSLVAHCQGTTHTRTSVSASAQTGGHATGPSPRPPCARARASQSARAGARWRARDRPGVRHGAPGREGVRKQAPVSVVPGPADDGRAPRVRGGADLLVGEPYPKVNAGAFLNERALPSLAKRLELSLVLPSVPFSTSSILYRTGTAPVPRSVYRSTALTPSYPSFPPSLGRMSIELDELSYMHTSEQRAGPGTDRNRTNLARLLPAPAPVPVRRTVPVPVPVGTRT